MKTPSTPYLNSTHSQAPLGAGGRFGSQCKYIFSLSKTHFPTTVKGEEGASENYERRGRKRESVGVKFFPISPLLPPVCCCLPGSSNIWHCLSPGLLVQAGRERLKGGQSANLRSALAGLKDHFDFSQSGSY